MKVQKEIPKKSDDKKELDKWLKKEYPVFLAEKKFICEIQSPNCRGKATCVHHTDGRGKDEVRDKTTWRASCEPCNLWCETDHAAAKAKGFKNPRHHKEDPPIAIGAHSLPYLCGITPSPDPQPESGQALVIEYSKTKAQVKKLKQRIEDDPDKYFFISKSGYEEKKIPLDMVAPLFKDFTMILNCSLPQEFIDYLTT